MKNIERTFFNKSYEIDEDDSKILFRISKLFSPNLLLIILCIVLGDPSLTLGMTFSYHVILSGTKWSRNIPFQFYKVFIIQ